MRVYGCYNDLCVYENFIVKFKEEGISYTKVDTSIVEEFPLCQIPPVPVEERFLPEACKIPGAFHFTRNSIEIVESCEEYGEASCMEKHDVLLYLMTYAFYAVSQPQLYLVLYNDELALPAPFFVKKTGEVGIEDIIIKLSSESSLSFFKKTWIDGRMEAVSGIYMPEKRNTELEVLAGMIWDAYHGGIVGEEFEPWGYRFESLFFNAGEEINGDVDVFREDYRGEEEDEWGW